LAQGEEEKRATFVFKVGKSRIPLPAGLGFGREPSKELKFVLVGLPSVNLPQGFIQGNANGGSQIQAAYFVPRHGNANRSLSISFQQTLGQAVGLASEKQAVSDLI